MSIATFIQEEVILPRVATHSVLVVYDPEKLYREMCLGLNGDRRSVIDASEGSIESREAALEGLCELGKQKQDRKIDELIVYVPAARPETDEEFQVDPFSPYASSGTIFPQGDGDEFQSLCLKAKPDHATELRRVFRENEHPTFAIIDAIGGGTGWPTLASVLKEESARGIILELMNPAPKYRKKLANQAAWINEATDLFQRSLGLTLTTQLASWEAVAEELWRFVLFSEFVFDLPDESGLPTTLQNVPRAPAEAQPFIIWLCDKLRDTISARSEYCSRAEMIEQTLNLPSLCKAIDDLGVRDTFPFEEKTLFIQAVDSLSRDNIPLLRTLIDGHATSIWVDHSNNHTKWNLLKAAQILVELCQDTSRDLTQHTGSMDALIRFYTSTAREVDRAHREFEEKHSAAYIVDHPLETIVLQTRKIYQHTTGKLHKAFMQHLAADGWTPSEIPSNNSVFDTHLVPRLKITGQKTAIFLIDALRYELGHELQKKLSEYADTEILACCASLPSVTPLGMASLLPDAAQKLSLRKVDDKAVVYYGDEPLNDIAARTKMLRAQYGDRVSAIKLSDLAQSKSAIKDSVDLLVIRSNDIDEQYESVNDPSAALAVIQRSLGNVRVAIHRLQELGFEFAVIATDHGFVLHHDLDAGGICQKPDGNWINMHDRLLLGTGGSDSANLVIPAAHAGVSGTFTDIAVPRALVPYRAGLSYFHGGASLQELVVPLIQVNIRKPIDSSGHNVKVKLTYREGKTKITSRIPFVTLNVSAADLFADGEAIEIRLEARDANNMIVGEPQPGRNVDPATKTISLTEGETLKIGIKMKEDFEGTFALKALDPATLVVLEELKLETEYMG